MINCLGVIGTGHLSGFVCEGLRKAGWQGELIVSGHNPEKAKSFALNYEATIAIDSQSLIENSDAVLVAVRPVQVVEALQGLNWRSGQLMISAMAGVKISTLQELASGATIVRSMPISSAAELASPTTYFPENQQAKKLFSLIGVAIAMNNEVEFEAASTNGAVYGWHFAMIDTLVKANEKAGLSPEVARKITIETLRSAAKIAAASNLDGAAILEGLATPGGMTAQGLSILREGKALEPWSEAFDSVCARIKEGNG